MKHHKRCTIKIYNPLEHALKRVFKTQHLLLKRSCLYPQKNVPPPPPFPKIINKTPAPAPAPLVPPPPPPPAPTKTFQRPTTTKPPVAPPPPPPMNKKKLVRQTAAGQTVKGGPLLNLEAIKRKSQALQAKRVEQLLQEDPVVKSFLQNKTNKEINDIKKRLINNRVNLNAESVRKFALYGQTLERLRQDSRLKNKPETFLMNNLGKYLPTNKTNKLSEDEITKALNLIQVERRVARLAGSNLKQNELKPIVLKLKNKPVNNIDINDISTALRNL